MTFWLFEFPCSAYTSTLISRSCDSSGTAHLQITPNYGLQWYFRDITGYGSSFDDNGFGNRSSWKLEINCQLGFGSKPSMYVVVFYASSIIIAARLSELCMFSSFRSEPHVSCGQVFGLFREKTGAPTTYERRIERKRNTSLYLTCSKSNNSIFTSLDERTGFLCRTCHGRGWFGVQCSPLSCSC